MGDAGRRGAHQHFGLGKLRADDLSQARLDVLAHLGGGQGQTVVAINGAFDTARPRERLLGTQEYRADREQVFCYGSLHVRIVVIFIQFHIQDRKRAALFVPLAAAADDEAHAFVKSTRRGIPFVDRDLRHARGKSLAHQRGADTRAATGRIDEEHLQPRPRRAHEGGRHARRIAHDPQLGHRTQRLGHLRTEAADVHLRQKVVRGAHRCLPQLREPGDERIVARRATFGSGKTDGRHPSALRKTASTSSG